MILPLNTIIQNDTIYHLENLNENIDAIRNIVDISSSTVANEISAVNTLLVAFSIVFAIVGIGLGIYISWLQVKVSEMSKKIAEKEEKIIRLANTVEETDKKIQSDISGLYAKLRNEETLTLLHRLEEEPQDINNLADLLLARPLNSACFPILKQAFLKLKSFGPEINKDDFIAPNYKELYTMLFFQHYLRESILDNELRADIMIDFQNSMTCAFKCDIIKSTEDFCQALSVNNAPFDKVAILVDYLKALNQSRFRNLIELKNIFQDNLKKDILVDAIDQCRKDKVYLELFGVKAPHESTKTANSEITNKVEEE